MPEGSLYPIILAAGKGTRMKSEKAKVLHEVFFKPMVKHVIDALLPLGCPQITVVTGHQAELVEKMLADYRLTYARQNEQLGTGHAVLMTRDRLVDKTGSALILCGDTPLMRSETLQEMVAFHRRHGGTLTVMTTTLEDSTNYGRILSEESGRIVGIVEEKDATAEQRAIKEINAGIYCVELGFLFDALGQVGTDNKQGEAYLTDIVEIANHQGLSVQRFSCKDSNEILGVNSRIELARASKILQLRRNRDLMLAGVSMMDPDTIFIEPSVEVGQDVSFTAHTIVRGRSKIGAGTVIEPFVYIADREIARGSVITAMSSFA